MDTAASSERIPPHGDDSAPRPQAGRAGTSDSLRALFDELIDGFGASVGTRFELLALESKRAVRASLRAIVMTLLGALLAITAWFALVAGLVAWAVYAGATLHWALLCVAAGGVVLAWASLHAVRKALSRIRFDATRRTLQVGAGAGSRSRAAGTSPGTAETAHETASPGRASSSGGAA